MLTCPRLLTAAAALALLPLAVHAQPACDRFEATLISSSQPALRDPSGGYNEFDGEDDHAIYYGAADWIRDPDSNEFLDGLVDLDFGMTFGNAGELPEGYDRQVKQIHEYKLTPAYALGVTSNSLQSATLEIYIDRVLDMTFGGATNLPVPEFMYIKSFAGDGVLTTLADAQVDYDRCDRKLPSTWENTVRLEDSAGNIITQDRIDNDGGLIVLTIDVTDEVRDLLAADEAFAGFTMAGSEGNHHVLLSVDGGDGGFRQLPRLILVGPARGDLDVNNTVDLADFALMQACFSGAGNAVAAGCNLADLDQDGDADLDDAMHLKGNLLGPVDIGTCGGQLVLAPFAAKRAATSARVPELGDFNADGRLGPDDPAHFAACLTRGPDLAPECVACDLNNDQRLDTADQRLFNAVFRR